MSLAYTTSAGDRYPIDPQRYCGDDGSLLDLDAPEPSFPWKKIATRPATLWRYEEALPVSSDAWRRTTLGEGMTPLIPFGPEHDGLLCKLDYLAPTLSFKDRGAAVLIAKAVEMGVRHCIADSSGNAGTSIAAYCARVGIACEVFVPAATSPKKLIQIAAHGARVTAVSGSREDVAAAALQAVRSSDAFYASHVYNPFFFEGAKTYAFELFEQIGEAPDVVILPAGNGTLVLGCLRGFQQLLDANQITRLPRFIVIQAQNCAPLAAAWANGARHVEPVETRPTAAEGIAIAAPRRGAQILDAVRRTQGDMLVVSEEEIQHAQGQLAKRGLFVEITSAVNYAGYLRFLKRTPEAGQLRVVIPLCGAGLKSA